MSDRLPDIYEFESSALARDLGRTFDVDESFGDIMVIASEQVVGIMCPRPFAVTVAAGKLEHLTGDIMSALTARGITPTMLRHAIRVAQSRMFPLTTWARSFLE